MRGLAIDARYRVVRNLTTSRNVTAWAGLTGNTISGATVSAAWAPGGLAVQHTWTARTNASGDGGALVTTSIAPKPGTIYTVSWSIVISDSISVATNATNWSATAGQVLGTSGTLAVVAGTPARFWVTFRTGPTGGVPASTRSDLKNLPLSAGVWVQDAGAMLVEGSTLYDYADGDSPSWRWDGTPGASTSRGLVFVP